MNVFDVLRERLKEKSEIYMREEEIQKSNPCYQRGVYGFKSLGYENAIEIVNQVEQEYENDFCEWEYDEFEDGWQTSCDAVFSLCDSDKEITNFCPCCGKKIKVVNT